MSSNSETPTWKIWLDKILVLDFFLVIAGSFWFVIGIFASSNGVMAPLNLFQRLWIPFFTPAISLLIGAALISGLMGWLQRQELWSDPDE